MIGDHLVTSDFHRAGAAKIFDAILPRLATATHPLVVAIAGETGAGKSETAACLCELLEDRGLRTLTLCQDDYFRLPPGENHKRRRNDPTWIGPGEVRLDLLDEHVRTLRDRPDDPIDKPLVFFDEDRIDQEIVHPLSPAVIVVEGTYTAMLESADVRVFIDRTYRQSRTLRVQGEQNPDPAFLETVLGIEHEIIAKHRASADILIAAPLGVRLTEAVTRTPSPNVS